MLDGIGSYRYDGLMNESAATLYSDNPYPCDLDRGITAGFVARFEPSVSVTHHDDACRKKGDTACTYLIQW
jgi:hypothetical protein